MPVVALGRVEPWNRILKVVPATGTDQARIAELRVKEGERVSAGQVLAVLDTAPRLKAALDVARTSVQLQKALLDRIRLEASDAVETNEATLKRWQEETGKDAWDVERTASLQKEGADSEISNKNARLALAQAQQQLSLAKIGLKRAAARGGSGNLLDVGVAETQLDNAQAALEQADAAYQETFVRAPAAGRVLKIYARIGEKVADQGLMDFGQTDAMAIRTEVYESDIGRVALGATAQGVTPVLPFALKGTVEEIAPIVAKQSIVSENPTADTDARIVEVRIRLDQDSAKAVRDLSNLQVRVSIAPSMGRPGAPASNAGPK
jgi:HlyD family secretion protein